jgi:hypothetical protein
MRTLSAPLRKEKTVIFQVVSNLRWIAPLLVGLVVAGCTGSGSAGLVPIGNAAGSNASSVANSTGSQDGTGSSAAADGSGDGRGLMPIGKNPNPLGGHRFVQ